MGAVKYEKWVQLNMEMGAVRIGKWVQLSMKIGAVNYENFIKILKIKKKVIFMLL